MSIVDLENISPNSEEFSSEVRRLLGEKSAHLKVLERTSSHLSPISQEIEERKRQKSLYENLRIESISPVISHHSGKSHGMRSPRKSLASISPQNRNQKAYSIPSPSPSKLRKLEKELGLSPASVCSVASITTVASSVACGLDTWADVSSVGDMTETDGDEAEGSFTKGSESPFIHTDMKTKTANDALKGNNMKDMGSWVPEEQGALSTINEYDRHGLSDASVEGAGAQDKYTTHTQCHSSPITIGDAVHAASHASRLSILSDTEIEEEIHADLRSRSRSRARGTSDLHRAFTLLSPVIDKDRDRGCAAAAAAAEQLDKSHLSPLSSLVVEVKRDIPSKAAIAGWVRRQSLMSQ